MRVEEMGQRRPIRPGGMRALEWLIELLRIAEQDDRARAGAHGEDVGERHLARFVDEEHVERGHGSSPKPRAMACRRRRRGRASPAGVRAAVLSVITSRPGRGVAWSAVVTFCATQQAAALFRGRVEDGAEKVVDHLVAVRADADALPGTDERHDHPRAGVGLAGTRRSLDGEGPFVERHGDPSGGCSSGSSSRRTSPTTGGSVRGGRRSRRSRAARHGPSASISCVRNPLPERQERGALVGVADDVERHEPGGVRRFAIGGLPREIDRPVAVVDALDPRLHTPVRRLPVRVRLAQRRGRGACRQGRGPGAGSGSATSDAACAFGVGRHGSPTGPIDLQGPERPLVDRQLSGVELHAPEELPPGRLVLPPVPAESSCARSHRAACSFVALRRVDGDIGRQPRGDLGHATVGCPELHGRVARHAARAAGPPGRLRRAARRGGARASRGGVAVLTTSSRL